MFDRLRGRHYDRRLARDYLHRVHRLSECWTGFLCWKCAWRSATGFFEREQAKLRKHFDEIRDDIPVVKITLTDEQKVRGLRGRMLNQIKAHGEVLCSLDPDDHDSWGLIPCERCGAAV